MTRAIIDADSYLYKAALTCNELVEIQSGIYYEAYNINKAEAFLTETFNSLASKCNCNEYILVTGGVGTNFRNLINPDYKANRKKQAKPIMLDKIKELVFNKYPTVYYPYLEADDTCRILSEEYVDSVIVSPDKDLKTFVGKVYDSYHDEVGYISPVQAEANFKRQLIIGDKTDGYSGLKGYGPAKADKLLLSGITIDDIAQMYIDSGLGIKAFKDIYNCAKILGKEDYKDGVITLYGGEKLDLRTYKG